MSARRIECAGSLGRACPAHAWVYYEGHGRPVERCPVCWERNEAERRRENRKPRAKALRLPSCVCGSCSRCRCRLAMQSLRRRRAPAARREMVGGGA